MAKYLTATAPISESATPCIPQFTTGSVTATSHWGAPGLDF